MKKIKKFLNKLRSETTLCIIIVFIFSLIFSLAEGTPLWLTFILFLLIFSSNVSANIFNGNPEIVDKLNSAFEKVESWMLKLATPAAAVAVAVGLFMKKFSFGDEERLRIAKKLIRGSLFSYAFILVLDLILSAISSLLT